VSVRLRRFARTSSNRERGLEVTREHYAGLIVDDHLAGFQFRGLGRADQRMHPLKGSVRGGSLLLRASCTLRPACERA
jgi:hypothetical protein